MSWTPGAEPVCSEQTEQSSIETVIESRPRDLGGFSVRRVLPSSARRMVGPFIFFDHLGPAVLEPGHGIDVRPHPHINLATVTYLFEGAIDHRDSLGSHQTIRPGAINWMTAGRGIVHSERTPPDVRAAGGPVHGLQLWVALPTDREETEPTFTHYPAAVLPAVGSGGASVRVLAGSAFGADSPVATASPTLYLDVGLAAGSSLEIPADYPERAAYVVSGAVECSGDRFAVGQMIVLAAGRTPRMTADGDARIAVVGGAPVDGPRHIWWNFVSSSKQRLDAAKAAWTRGPGNSDRFPLVPGDDQEMIPLPE
jgi:redox-sensitive bicupin YhaK (pirin superfamily)